MKAKSMVLGFVLITIVILVTGCMLTRTVTLGHISDELKVAPDPQNPFQGTWQDSSQNYLHVIKGMNGTWYTFDLTSYKESAVYMIERSGNGYVTSNNWRIRVDGDVLTVENMTYRRVTE